MQFPQRVGGDVTLEKPRLYVTMDSGRIRMEKVKSYANPLINPNGAELEFKLVKGCMFLPQGHWVKDGAPLGEGVDESF